MPTLSQFYGIIIKMYFQKMEHEPPHIHIFYGGYEAEVSIETGKVIAGRLPVKVAKLVKKWTIIHGQELLEIWRTQQFKKIKPLE